MMPETKLVKTASRSALAGRGERNRLLDDCKAPEAGRMVSQNRLGQAPEPPDPYRDARVAGQHDDSKTQQLHRRSGQTGSMRPCANVLAAQTLAGLRFGDRNRRCCLSS